MTTPALTLSHVSLDVTDGSTTRHLLTDVSVDVMPGEVVGVTGPSGSGKSTLLAIAGTLQKPTAGTATLRCADGSTVELAVDQALTYRQSAQLRREHIGLVFQQPNLLPSLTVKDQLLAMTRLNRVLPWGRGTWRREEDKALRLLQDVGLGGLEDRKVSQLSGGQQARVNLARALMNDPDLLLVDEPTAALDTENATKVTELILELAHRTGIPTLYVSHDQSQLARLDHTVTIVDGKIKELATVR